jgi:hypothetical protein
MDVPLANAVLKRVVETAKIGSRQVRAPFRILIGGFLPILALDVSFSGPV